MRSQSCIPTHSPTIADAADGSGSADGDAADGATLSGAKLEGAELDGTTGLAPPPLHAASAIVIAMDATRRRELLRISRW